MVGSRRFGTVFQTESITEIIGGDRRFTEGLSDVFHKNNYVLFCCERTVRQLGDVSTGADRRFA